MDEIAIIGAGLAGVTAGRVVAAAGWPVRLFDKSRGLGGRLATRRGPGFALDHGAPGIRTDDAAFAASLAGAGGVADPDWGFVGQPGMSGLVKTMATGLDVETGVELMGLADTGSRLTLIDQAGRGHGPFGHVISPIPAPQARRQTRDLSEADTALAADELSRFYNYFGAWFQTKRAVSQGHIDPLSDADMAGNAMMAPGNMARDLTIGTAQEVIDQIKRYEDLGYDEYSFWIDSGMSIERKRASLDRFINDVMPAFA